MQQERWRPRGPERRGLRPSLICDAHPDFDTPDEAVSGYFDGMGVATLAGQCWRTLAASVPGHRPLDLAKLAYCAIRDFDPGQREKVEAHHISVVYSGPVLPRSPSLRSTQTCRTVPKLQYST